MFLFAGVYCTVIIRERSTLPEPWSSMDSSDSGKFVTCSFSWTWTTWSMAGNQSDNVWNNITQR